jgi:hypothetical protein
MEFEMSQVRRETPGSNTEFPCGCALCAFLLAIVLVFLAVSMVFFYDGKHRVEITVRNIPDETRTLFLVAESAGNVEVLNWWATMVISDEENPIGTTLSYPEPGKDFIQTLIWKPAERYGVVRNNKDGTQWITWFEKEMLTIKMEKALFDLSKGQTEPLPKKLLMQIEPK